MNETTSERVHLAFEDAAAMLPDKEYIHTFSNPTGGVMLGCDIPRDRILEIIREHGAELSGETATSMHHGLWVNDGKPRGLFIETREPPHERDDREAQAPDHQQPLPGDKSDGRH